MTPKSTSTRIFIDVNFGNLSYSEIYILEDAGRSLLEYFHAAKRKANISHRLQQRISLCDRKSNSRLFVIHTITGISAGIWKTILLTFTTSSLRTDIKYVRHWRDSATIPVIYYVYLRTLLNCYATKAKPHKFYASKELSLQIQNWQCSNNAESLK